MKSNFLRKLIPVLLVVVVLASILTYLVLVTRHDENGVLNASGTVEAVQVQIAPEIGGRVAAVLVREGQWVEQGDALLQIDDSLYQAQNERAMSAMALAQANLEAAHAARETADTSLAAAQAQYEIILTNARLQSLLDRSGLWAQSLPTEISQPVWYFARSEEITAAREELFAAAESLTTEQAYFDQLTSGINSSEFINAEERLSQAQAAFLVANDVLGLAEAQRDEDILQHAQDLYDAALAELDSAQTQYDRILTEKTAQDIKEARARISVARQRRDAAQDRLDALLIGEDSLVVQAAQIAILQAQSAVNQSETGITQAQRAVEQAQTEINLVQVQISKLTLYAPISGVVMVSNVETGEVLQPGAGVMVIGQLDDLTITVFIAEDRYGDIFLGQEAHVSVDTFSDQVFDALVIQIAEQAEYTPRNVQTEEGRRTTVFAIKLAVQDPQGRLKPGMPADVEFIE